MGEKRGKGIGGEGERGTREREREHGIRNAIKKEESTLVESEGKPLVAAAAVRSSQEPNVILQSKRTSNLKEI